MTVKTKKMKENKGTNQVIAPKYKKLD